MFLSSQQQQCPEDIFHWKDEDVALTEFSNTRAIEFMHQRSPRFGNSNELIVKIQEDDDSYVDGLIAISIASGVFFILWACLIIFLAFKAPSPWNGHTIIQPPPPQAPEYPQAQTIESEDSENEEIKPLTKSKKLKRKKSKIKYRQHSHGKFYQKSEPMQKDPYLDKNLTEEQVKDYVHQYRKYKRKFNDWEEKSQIYRRKVKVMRFAVVIGCCMIIAASLIFSVKGFKHLVASVESGRDILTQGEDMTDQGLTVVDAYLTKRAQFAESHRNLMQQLNGFCPKVTNQVCGDILTGSDCQFEGLPYSLILNNVVDYASTLHDELLHDILDFRHDLTEALALFQRWQSTLDDFNWALYTAISFSLCLALLCVYIMTGVILAWRDRLPSAFVCLRSTFVIPLFMLLVFFSWVFATVFMLGSISLADFCIDSPDTKVMALIHRYGDQLSPTVANFALYFVSGKVSCFGILHRSTPRNADLLLSFFMTGCTNWLLPPDFDSKMKTMLVAMENMQDLKDTLQSKTFDFQSLCGIDPQPIAEASTLAEGQLCTAATFMGEVQRYFGCRNWFPVYEVAAHETICYEASDGFAWVTISQFIIVFVAMVVLTLRVAVHPTNGAFGGNTSCKGATASLRCKRQPYNIYRDRRRPKLWE